MKASWRQLESYPVIPVVWDDHGIEEILHIPVAFVYLQDGSIFSLEETCRRIKSHQPHARIFFHIDLAAGIAADEAGVRFAKTCGIDGLVTTRPSLIEAGKKYGLETVLRAFLQDSRSLRRTLQLCQRCMPDGLDLLPGPVLPEVMDEITSVLSQPVIGGGLVRRPEQVWSLLRAGCRAVSTSTPALWALNRSSPPVRPSPCGL
ncbi:MAG: glycerol-3-phosphate responsive antiterminator [Symbiobacterium sp.]|uniref:glycerol-3-phosphate responsive antiterminator n=1 Tax=Symbiobacterium sp. TaxID=1971213 RepID=UPI0034640660